MHGFVHREQKGPKLRRRSLSSSSDDDSKFKKYNYAQKVQNT